MQSYVLICQCTIIAAFIILLLVALVHVYLLSVFSSLLQLLGDMLLDRSNSAVMTQYVSSRDNLRILMNLLRVWSCL